MSQFRDLLKQYFEENEVNISRLSQQCGIDRTTIQHMVGNRRDYKLPSFEVLRKVLSILPMTPGEQQYIEELFTIEKIGRYHYMGRKHVKSILEQIASLHNSDSNGRKPASYRHFSLNTEDSLFKGVNAVNSIVYSVCADEIEAGGKPRISLNVPFTYAYLKQTLLQLYWEMEGRLEIEHIVSLDKSPSTNLNPNVNLETISQILPFAFGIGQGYRVHYYYSSLDPENERLLLLPYYLITSRHLLLLSGDFTAAILVKDAQMIDEYRSMFEKGYAQCQPLIQHIANPLDIFDAYSACISDGCLAYAIETFPCLFQHMSEDVVLGSTRMDIPDIDRILEGFFGYLNRFSKLNFGNYFLAKGLEAFAKTGKLVIFPEGYVGAFPTEARIEMLEAVIKDIRGGGKTRLADASKISLSTNATISTIGNNSLQFYYFGQGAFHYCVIKENSIVDSFVDFFESLPQSDMLFSAEETICVIQSCIDELKMSEVGVG